MTTANVTVNVKENGKSPNKYSLMADLDGEVTLAQLFKFTKGALIGIATDALKEEQGFGFDKKPLTLVDGKPNRDINDVNPLGKIQYIARQDLAEIITYAYDAVFARSPRGRKGQYVSSNLVTYNGVQVANSPSSLKSWLDGKSFQDKDKIRITNATPYARKLELQGVRFGVVRRRFGKPGKKGYVSSTTNAAGQVRKPNGAYTIAAKAIKAKYGRNTFIKYELMLGSDLGLTGVRKTGFDIGRPYVYPSILIYAFDTSTPDKGTQ